MCTVSLQPLSWGLRLVGNRDEQHVRPDALPPEVWTCGSRQVVAPRDPQGGGTWIAANDRGLVLTLLNHTVERPLRPGSGLTSRGLLIPELCLAEAVEEVAEGLEGLTRRWRTAPFRLLACDGQRWLVARWAGRRLQIRLRGLAAQPLMLTSSGLGDRLVRSPRRQLFRDQSAQLTHWADSVRTAAQDRFHRHAWANRGALSVTMDRADARTVSRTVVEVREDAVLLRYRPRDPAGQLGAETRVGLGRAARRASA